MTKQFFLLPSRWRLRTRWFLFLPIILFPCLCWTLANIAVAAPVKPVEDAQALLPNVPIKREIKGGEQHSYAATLEAGQFTVVSVKQENSDLVLTLTSADGRQIVELNHPELSIFAETTARYVIGVRARYKDTPVGWYEINLASPRPATAQDKARAAGERSLSEGGWLFAQSKTPAIREAIEKFQGAASLFREAQQPLLEASALIRVGQSYLTLVEKIPTARDYLHQALALARAHQDRSREAQTLREIGRTYQAIEGAQPALDYYNQALKLYDTLGNARGKAHTLLSMAIAASDMEDYQQALDYYHQALTLFKALGDRMSEAAVYNNLAMEYKGHGDFQKALENYNQALPLSRATGDRVLEVKVFNNMGIIYKDMGDYRKALDLYEQSLTLSRSLSNEVAEVQVLNNIGNVYRAEGENQKALDYYNQALTIFRRLKMRGGEATALNNIGAIYSLLGEPQKALDYIEQSRAIRSASGDRRGEASALNQAGRAWYQLGDLGKAFDCLRQALEIRRQINDPLGETETLFNLARVEQDRGQWADARTKIETALARIESLRANISNPGLRASYVARAQEAFEFYIALLMRQHQQSPLKGYDALALQASERAQARVLLELLVEARADIRQGVAPALLDRERLLQQQLDTKSGRLTQLLSGKYSEAQKTAAEKELSDLLTSYQDMQTQIRQSSPRYAALTQPQPLTAAAIQQQLDSDSVLLKFALGEKQSWLWAVTQASINSYPLPASQEIEPLARKVYELLTARQPRKGETVTQYQTRISDAESELQSAIAALSQMLFGQLATKLQQEWKGKRLVIVASGALEYIPFAALPIPVAGVSEAVVGGRWSGISKAEVREAGVGGQGSGISEKQIAHRPLPPDHRPPLTDHRPPTTDHRPLTAGYRPLIAEHEIVNLPSFSVLAAIRNESVGRKAAEKTIAVIADPVFEPSDPRVLNALKKSSATPIVAGLRSGHEPPAAENQTLPAATPNAELLSSLKNFRAINERSGFSRLPFSRDEAEAIVSLTAKNASLKATDFQATSAIATSGQLSRFRIIHFATHGLLNSQRPELSGLVLSLVDEQGNPQDGFLRMHEIYNLNLPADLIVLSACQTALGKEIKGEGLVGLTRGFMYAGAQRVVASLWQVDDLATAELMKRFYRAMLKDGLRPAAALRAAQLEMLKQKRWSAPYFWAAFTIQGEWK